MFAIIEALQRFVNLYTGIFKEIPKKNGLFISIVHRNVREKREEKMCEWGIVERFVLKAR